MNHLIEHLLSLGLPQETVILLLLLPIVVTVIALARQVIGIRGFGIYTPLIISFAFLASGLKYGLALFLAIILVGTLIRYLVKKLHLLYLPRMAIVLTVVALAILILLWLGGYFHKSGLINTSIFAILIMITLVEKFIAAQIERGLKKAVILTLETMLLSIVCYILISWSWLQATVSAYPYWVILAVLLINIFLGRWAGLRLTEYFRFRETIKRIELPKK